LHLAAFPGTARQGRCGAVQVNEESLILRAEILHFVHTVPASLRENDRLNSYIEVKMSISTKRRRRK
jgi:hypothetical protein